MSSKDISNEFEKLVNNLKEYGVSDDNIKSLLLYLKDNKYDYNKIMKDISDKTASMLFQFFRDELNNIKLYDILCQVINNKHDNDSNEWQCPQCTFINSIQQQLCGICDFKMPQKHNNNNSDNDADNNQKADLCGLSELEMERRRRAKELVIMMGGNYALDLAVKALQETNDNLEVAAIWLLDNASKELDRFFENALMFTAQNDENGIDDTIGLSVGGAKDVNNFRHCIEKNIMPNIDSITYNGLLSEYYFDTKTTKHIVDEKKNDDDDDGSMLFYPTYCYAKIQNNNNDDEYYMTVGLNSNIKQNAFKRKHLNLVILWDKSGSMNESFDGDNDNESFDIDIDINGEWRKTFKVNDKIDVKDGDIWYNAEVVEVNNNDNKIKIHYIGWSDKYDEYITFDNHRLAPFNSSNTKMICSKKAIKSILKQLTSKDRLGIVTFNSNANIEQKLQFINDINMDNLKQIILNIGGCGGTNFEKGYNKTIELYEKLFNDEEYQLNWKMNDEYDNRIIILTDAQPNEGISSSNELIKIIAKCAGHDNINNIDENEWYCPQCTLINSIQLKLCGICGFKMPQKHNNNNNNNDDNDNKESDPIYSTFIGIGLDFNSSLIENISSIRGCNYYSVKKAKEFDVRMNEEFDNMVTPLVFNVCLKLKCEGNMCSIKKVYGSNEENKIMENGEMIKIDTLFASKKSNKKMERKGGIQLIKLQSNNDKNDNNDSNINVELEVTFQDRNGSLFKNTQNVTFKSLKQENNINNDMIEIDENEKDNFYDNNGIRKAILLCKYVELIKKWIHSQSQSSSKTIKINDDKMKQIIVKFAKHFEKEMIQCHDRTLQKEMDILNKLINFTHSQ